MDKASILGDAIKYVKELKEKEKILEEQVAMRKVESAVFLNRSCVMLSDDVDNIDENCGSHQLPEIEARVSGEEVLIRIQCERQKGCESAILTHLQNLHLTLRTTTIVPFANTTLSITILAQVLLLNKSIIIFLYFN